MKNNVRLIDANALIKHYSCVEAQKSSAEKIRAEIIVQALENAPTITPQSLRPVGRDDREKLIELLARYFTIGDSYAYNLTRVKSAFAVGTVSLDDFVEFDDEVIADIANYLVTNGVSFAAATNDGSKWVPVTDRLPTQELEEIKKTAKHDSYHCLVYRKARNSLHGFFVSEAWFDEIGFTDIDNSLIDNLVTHWKPLPEPPKGE